MQIPNENKLVTVTEMQGIERAADAAGHTYATMMEMAGTAVAEIVRERWSGQASVLILVGPGNNGGDGLVCARHLQQAGVLVHVYLWQRATDTEHDYAGHFARLVALGVPTAHADEDPNLATLGAWLDESTLVVDALLGTGSNRPIAGQLAQILDAVRAAQTTRATPDDQFTILAVDCPSGLNCDSGATDPYTVPADVTVTFAHAKAGHYKFPGASIVGELLVADIGTPPQLSDSVQTFCLSADLLRPCLPVRSLNSHKGSFGKVMAVVGCVNYAGAAYLSCAAAGRVGAGLVTGAIAEPVWPVVASKLAEATWLPLPTGNADDAGFIGEAAAPIVSEAVNGYSALLVGCGLGQAVTTQHFLRSLLAHPILPPTLIDADGLNCLAQRPKWPTLLPHETILTPHAAEMARLCQLSVAEVRAQRWALAREKAAAWNAIVLLKGPYTIIAHPDGRMAVLPVATPALATAGTGDVLAGTIVGLVAQGVAPFWAACAGAWLHGKTGERCQDEIGLAGVLASDLLPRLPRTLRELQA